MDKKIVRAKPFYDDKKYLAIFDDRMIILGAGGRVVYFKDVHYIIFRENHFALYTNYKQQSYITVIMKYMGMFDLPVPINGYYALKKYYEKGVKTDGKDTVRLFAIMAIMFLMVFIIFITAFLITAS